MIRLKDLPKSLQATIVKSHGIGASTNKAGAVVPRSSKRRSKAAFDPQQRLSSAIEDRWPGVAHFNYRPFADRKFEIDIAFVDDRIAIEVDGWQYHGKFKNGFQRDREKQNRLVMEGWRPLRFFYREIRDELGRVLDDIEKARSLTRA